MSTSESHLRRSTGSIIGRTDEVRAVRQAIEQRRLVSLVGPGGVGKTALAAEVAHELEPEFERVVAVELVEESDPSQVRRRISTAILAEPDLTGDRLTAALDGVATLLVVDNCEHLVDDVADELAALLASTASLRILVTTRRPLGLGDETIVPVHPLPTPARHDSERVMVTSAAIQLFLERVRQAVPNFELTATNRPLVADICIASDGVPLVLELAAALVRSRPLDEILIAMTERLDALGPPRRDRSVHQRSVAASLDWSRQFLTDSDGRLLDRLSVFTGGFTAEGARHVDPTGATEGLSRLVDHSLVDFDVATGRYRLLEVVRIDAARRLEPVARAEAEHRHLTWCLALAERIGATRFAADPELLFPRFELELPNLCSAARRCLATGDLAAFRSLLGPIAVWWVHYVPPDDPEVWRSAFDDDDVPIEWRANIDAALSFYWSHRNQHEQALALALKAAPEHAAADDSTGQALALLAAGNARLALGDPPGARADYDRALALSLEAGEPYPELLARLVLARLDPPGPARQHLTRALVLAQDGFVSIEALASTELGLVALKTGDLSSARRHCDVGLGLALAHGYGEARATALCARAEVALAEADTARARPWFDEARAIGTAHHHQGLIDRAEAGLFEVARLGAGRSADDTIGPAPGPPADSLSDRELAVARLLRGDLTQREIADELYIAPSTVKTHTKSIYRKLGVSKRSSAVTRATELGLFG